MRLSDFENLIQDLCGHIMAKNLPYAEIIHGHGDGILKNWLRSFLKKQGDLEGIVDLQKSDGVTTIQRKN
jgi:DNA mismatch repair protein MutS2